MSYSEFSYKYVNNWYTKMIDMHCREGRKGGEISGGKNEKYIYTKNVDLKLSLSNTIKLLSSKAQT